MIGGIERERRGGEGGEVRRRGGEEFGGREGEGKVRGRGGR